MGVTPNEFRKAMGCFATGVTVITIDQEDEVHGMTANAFTSVSLDPMLVLVCADRTARTHAQLHARKRFGVAVREGAPLLYFRGQYRDMGEAKQ